MKKLFSAGLAGLAVMGMGSAHAADVSISPYPAAPSVVLTPAPYFEWFGPYVGALVGGGLENTQTNYSYASRAPTTGLGFEGTFGPGPPVGASNVGGGSAIDSAIARGFLPTSLGKRTTGFLTAGGQVGFNFQMAQIVFGFEGDAAWMSGVKRTNFVAPPNPSNATNVVTQTAGLQWLSTIRFRLGYALNRLLIYGTGGVAIAKASGKTDELISDGTHTDFFSGAGSRAAGLAVGGGIEYAVTDHITAKAEYLFYDFGTVRYQVPATGAAGVGQGLTINASQRFDGHLFRVGLNFKPDWL